MDSQDNGGRFMNILLNETNSMSESQFPSTIEEHPPSLVDMNNKKKRGGNFSMEEDVFIVSCWLNTSIDPVVGSDQKGATFWLRVLELYTETTKNMYPERTMTSLTCRWKTIQKAVNKFQGFFAQIEARRQSGKTEQNQIDEAKAMYRSIQKSAFPYESCWSILRDELKWTTHTSLNACKRKISYTVPPIPDSTDLDDGTTSIMNQQTWKDQQVKRLQRTN